jgi:hypothetical protein
MRNIVLLVIMAVLVITGGAISFTNQYYSNNWGRI